MPDPYTFRKFLMLSKPGAGITDTTLPELTLRGMILGALITVIFTASNVYLGLKVGMTFSSSIPAAVISMAILRMYSDSNVLENNAVQTQASAAGTLSTIIFILPGLLMLGYWQGFAFFSTFALSALGGILGVLFTIPLRRAMVIHSDLPYPEGRAAAEILKVGSKNPQQGQSGESNASGLRELVAGSSLAGIFSFCAGGLHVFASEISLPLLFGRQAATQLGLSFSPALVSAGYLIGLPSGIAMMIGAAIAWFGFVPYLTATADVAAGTSPSDLAVALWVSKVRFIGAGCIGIAAIWTLLTLMKSVVNGVRESLASARTGRSASERALHHTDIDLSPKAIAAIFLVSVTGLFFIFFDFVSDAQLSLGVTLIFTATAVAVAVIVGFLVASACAYMAGLLGASSSPISGTAIIGIIIASLVFFGLSSLFDIFALEGGTRFATALAIFTTSAVVAVATISNDNMQDLKTGQLVGATPWRQQTALILGCIAGAVALAPVLNLLYQAYGFPGALPRPGMDPAQALSAPQATLMTSIARGIFNSNLEWDFILIGIGLGAVSIVADRIVRGLGRGWSLPPLAVGFGIYLPLSLNTAVMLGALLGYFVNRQLKKQSAGEEDFQNSTQRGVLFASGLIVGESLVGVLTALLIVLSVTAGGSADPLSLAGMAPAGAPVLLGTAAFVLLIAVFAARALRGRNPR